MDSAIRRIHHYPLDNSIGVASAYPLGSDLSGGQRYPSSQVKGFLGVGVHGQVAGHLLGKRAFFSQGTGWLIPSGSPWTHPRHPMSIQ